MPRAKHDLLDHAISMSNLMRPFTQPMENLEKKYPEYEYKQEAETKILRAS